MNRGLTPIIPIFQRTGDGAQINSERCSICSPLYWRQVKMVHNETFRSIYSERK